MDAPLIAPDPTWAAAEAVAEAHRRRFGRPPAARRHLDAVLLGAAAVLWVIATVLTSAEFAVSDDAVFTVALVADGAMVAYLVVALVWAGRWGAYLLRRSPWNIRTAVPAAAWPAVRQQLAGRIAVDPDHRDVIVELARQQRRLLAGQAVVAAFYVPFLLGIAHENRHADPPVLVVLLLGAIALLAALGFGVVARRRFTRIITAPGRA